MFHPPFDHGMGAPRDHGMGSPMGFSMATYLGGEDVYTVPPSDQFKGFGLPPEPGRLQAPKIFIFFGQFGKFSLFRHFGEL